MVAGHCASGGRGLAAFLPWGVWGSVQCTTRAGRGAGVSSDDALGVAADEGEADTSGGRKARLLSVKMSPHWSTREVQAALLQAAGMAHSKWIPTTAVRLRDARGSLVPLTPATLRSSPTRPLHMEIMATGKQREVSKHFSHSFGQL